MNVFRIAILGTFFVGTALSSAQTLSPGQRQALVDSLSSDSPRTCMLVVDSIIQYQVTEAAPVLESKIWNKSSIIIKLNFLKAIAALDSANMPPFAHTIIDSSGYYQRNYFGHFRDSALICLQATYYLIKAHDFSTVIMYLMRVADRINGWISL